MLRDEGEFTGFSLVILQGLFFEGASTSRGRDYLFFHPRIQVCCLHYKNPVRDKSCRGISPFNIFLKFQIFSLGPASSVEGLKGTELLKEKHDKGLERGLGSCLGGLKGDTSWGLMFDQDMELRGDGSSAEMELCRMTCRSLV